MAEETATAPADQPNSVVQTDPIPVPENPTGLRRTWLRFQKTRGGRIGLWLVIAFSLLAFLAPCLAHRSQYFWYDRETGSLTWPLVREFFAPADTTEPALERGINFLFLFLPLAIVAWRLLDKYLPALRYQSTRLVALLFGVLAAAALWLAIGGMVVDAGGDDWLYSFTAPVPEMDDIRNPEVAVASTTAIAAPLRDSVQHLGPGADREDWRRHMTEPLQSLIEGPLLPTPDIPDFATPGIDRDNLITPLDRARWNRTVVEAELPGLLLPMRQFRSTFVIMVVVSVLVLLGLTYICLAGAWQFSLSPKWLVLMVLAALLAQAFRLPARHDYTPYRELAEAGNGYGIFPLIPYGPNEQGFGPQLPPFWVSPSPFLEAGTIASPTLLRDRLLAPAGPAAESLQAALATVPGPDADSDDTTALRLRLNTVIQDGNLYTDAIGNQYRRDMNLGPYVQAAMAGQELSRTDRERMNRLIVERAVPGALESAPAGRWKKPRHLAGVHVFGTDESSRDVLVRMIHGARVSLSVGFVSVFLATVIGLVMGSLAAYYGGRVDMIISRFMEIMMCFPSFFLILAVIAVLERRSIVNIMLVIGLTSWTGVARLIRGEMLRQKRMEYVSASIALGASDTRTIFRHILPNAMAPVLVSISFGITGAILTEAGLSFIGFGVTPPTPTWGQLLSETRESPLANWWLAVFPGLVLFISVLAYNLVGEALRDALDPRTTL
ncbi:MAG: ABC transporter permease [Planctomycetes bacterium]|nr:ABC transporter permease [Planctomycetota bacterium]